MRHLLLSLILLALVAAVTACGQTQKPEPADGILKAAIQKAGSSNKIFLLIFHASWCGWCKRLDAALEDRNINDLRDFPIDIGLGVRNLVTNSVCSPLPALMHSTFRHSIQILSTGFCLKSLLL